MERRIGKLTGHYIVCGYARVGEQVVRDLEQQGQAVVVIETGEGVVARLADRHPHLLGDATDETVLAAAGIARAEVTPALERSVFRRGHAIHPEVRHSLPEGPREVVQ